MAYNEVVVISSSPQYRVVFVNGEYFIDFREQGNNSLKESIYDQLTTILDCDTIDDFGYRYPVLYLIANFNVLQPIEDELENGKEFFAYLREERTKRDNAYSQRVEKGILDMHDLPRYFPKGKEVIFSAGDTQIAGVVSTVSLQHSWQTGPYYQVSVSVVHAIKGLPEEGIFNAKVQFPGVAKIPDIPVQYITPEQKATLAERGEKFTKFFKPGTYLSYKGHIIQHGYWSDRIFRGDGRVVIDPVSFERQEANVWRDAMSQSGVRVNQPGHGEGGTAVVPKQRAFAEKDLWRVYTALYGFSFAVKQWGFIDFNGLSDINWRDDAFEKLVMHADDKDLIHSLVKFHGGGFTDIIEGKGGGCIFLLHGKPGFGKTASAEAVAELLHKPLYSVSVGELGVDPQTLEQSLRNILDVATIWDAVILLDEADIFLEERDEHNVGRNAMVGVFLRLLEYHNGVLFLTTNRVKNFDKAFFSRISVALLYDVTDGKVEKIWRNLLGAAGLSDEWAKELAVAFVLNGRQIKNSIRMAQTFARSRSGEVGIDDLKRAAGASVRFEKDMQALAAKAAQA